MPVHTFTREQTLYIHTCTYTIIVTMLLDCHVIHNNKIIASYTGPLQPDITKQIYLFFKGQW